MPLARINNHDMYYEIHGAGDALICSGGWGTFCHGDAGHLPRGLTDRYRVVIFDHRGIGRSGDDVSAASTTALYADDVIGLLASLGIDRAHFVGIIGIGACIFQEVAIRRPDLVRSLVNTGCWSRPDTRFRDQLTFWLDIHRAMGFEMFQRLVVMQGFDAAFYAANKQRLLGPHAAWRDLNGRIDTHRRLTEAGLTHDTRDRLGVITAPTLVMHNGRDEITPPHLTLAVEQGIRTARGHWMPDAAHVATGRTARAEFCEILLGFLAEH